MREIRLNANDLEFHILVEGESDKLILFLHGFPDDARSFAELMSKFAADGYMCAAPYMRGYAPTGIPENIKSSQFSTVQIIDLAQDAEAIVYALRRKYSIQSVTLVGHDWGAIAAYGAVNYAPELYDRAVMMSVPPGPTFLRNLVMNPMQFARSWYILFFQLPFFPENTIETGGGEFIRKLWHDWSKDSEKFEARIQEVVKTLSSPYSLRSALAYYRGLLRPPLSDWPKWNESRELFLSEVKVPSLILAGENDNCIAPEMFKACENDIPVPGSRYSIIPGAGHFLPLEAPDALYSEIKQFLE